MQTVKKLIVGFFLACLFVLPSGAVENDAPEKVELAPAGGEIDTTYVKFVAEFLSLVAEDESYRDACNEDLDACLEAAKLIKPDGLAMAYAYDAESGHSVKYQGGFASEVEVTLDAEGQFNVVESGGLASRGTIDTSNTVYQWFAYKCYAFNLPEPFYNSCRTGRTVCRCAENRDKYPCDYGYNFALTCENQ